MQRIISRFPLLTSSLAAGAMCFSSWSLAEEQACPSPQDFEYHGEPQVIELTPEDSQTLIAMVEILTSHHYQKLRVDDQFSQDLLDAYLERLDPSKSYFLQSEVDQYRQAYGDMLDDFIRRGELRAAEQIFLDYRERALSRLETVIAELEDPAFAYSFETEDTLAIERDLYEWPADPAAADEHWNKLVRLGLLNFKLSGEEIESAREKLARRYKSQLSFLKQQKSIHVLDQYLNAIGRLYDPHTDYFSPRNSENFEINMSLKLEGIGAVLQNEDELTKVVSLVPGGPAEASGQLEPGDRITNIAEGLECDFIDVVGWRIDEVVDLIRGPKGTHVRLEVIPKEVDELSEERKIVEIVRDEVKLEDNAAKSELVEVEVDGNTRKVGVIDIPSFYLDINALQAGDKDYRSTTRDVKDLITELQDQGMEGLVLDLRQNGGGSLLESATLTDLFIEPGPVVQIRDQNNKIYRQNRARQRAFYDGPLIVLIDRLSASASEIFAGAIQDYDRGLVVGSQSFGKGTVQTVLPLPKGQIKITESKFYRISGESTQHRGVTPNIEFPSLFDPEDIGESSYDNALSWDQITGIPHKRYEDLDDALPVLLQRHEQRLQLDPDLLYLQNRIAINNERRSEDYVSLNEAQRLSEREYWEDRELAIENEWRISRGLPPKEADEEDADATDVALSPEPDTDVELISGASSPAAVEEDDEDEEEPDAILDETARILIDYINLDSPSANSLVTN